jgi:hypothetical protein
MNSKNIQISLKNFPIIIGCGWGEMLVIKSAITVMKMVVRTIKQQMICWIQWWNEFNDEMNSQWEKIRHKWMAQKASSWIQSIFELIS